MFCVECGDRLMDGGKFCHACGTSLKKICDTSDSELPTINIKPKVSGSNVQSNSVVNRERIKSNLATLKAKFLESKSKMDARRLKKGRNEPLPSTGLETLEVRFIDRSEKRMQRMLPEGSSFLNIEVESVSTSEDWMRMVTALFKTEFTMHPVLLREGKYQELPSGSTLDFLKGQTKGKHKHHGFYVKVYASRGQLVKNLIRKDQTNRDRKDISQSSLQPEEVKDVTDLDSDISEDEFRSKPKRRKGKDHTSNSMHGDTFQQDDQMNQSPENQTTTGPHISKRKDYVQPTQQTSTPIHGHISKLEIKEDIEPIGDSSVSSPSLKEKKEKQLIIDDFWEELPDLEDVEKDASSKKAKTDYEGECEFLKDFEEIMQKKKERQTFAESTVIEFPWPEEARRISIVYESHGGLGFTRPFKLDDTLRSIYIWILREVEAEILPPVFHLECQHPTQCLRSDCSHVWKLERDHAKKISDLPSVMFLREGCFAADDTFTGFGDVLFNEVK